MTSVSAGRLLKSFIPQGRAGKMVFRTVTTVLETNEKEGSIPCIATLPHPSPFLCGLCVALHGVLDGEPAPQDEEKPSCDGPRKRCRRRKRRRRLDMEAVHNDSKPITVDLVNSDSEGE